MKETAGPSCGNRGRVSSPCSHEEVELSVSVFGSHNVFRSDVRVAPFLARFLRPRAFFPLGIAAMPVCRVADNGKQSQEK